MEILELKVIKHGVDEGLKSLIEIQKAIDYINSTPAVIRVDSKQTDVLKNITKSANDASTAFNGFASATRKISEEEETLRSKAAELTAEYGKLSRVVVDYDQRTKKATKATATYTDGVGKTVDVVIKLNKASEATAGVIDKATVSIEKQEKAAQKAAEQEKKALVDMKKQILRFEQQQDAADEREAASAERTAERRVSAAKRAATAVEHEHERERAAIKQTEQRSTTLEKQYDNLARSVQNLSKKYPAGTFDNVTNGIERASSSLRLLNQLWADEEITGAEYQAGISNLGSAFKGYQRDIANIRKETKELDKNTESFLANLQKFARWYFLGNIFSKVVGSFRDALSVMKDVDSELANIQKVTDRTDAEMQKLAKSAYSVASEYGVAATDYLQSVSTFAKAGYKELSESLAELATKTQLVGDVTSDIANQFLISVDAAWKMNGNVAMLSKTLDAANTIENNYATSIQKLAEGMPIVASTAAQAGMSVEETMAALGTITSVTQESGTKAATALRALLLNLIGAAGEYEDGIEVTEESIKSLNDVLNVYAADAMKAAEAAGTVINPMTAIAALAEASEKGALNQAGLFEMLSGLGGKLRTNQLTALVTNFKMFNEQLEMAEKNAGSADAELEVMLGTWDAKTKILKNTWTEFISNTVDSGLIKWFVDAGTAVIDFSDNIGLAVIAIGGLVTIFKGSEITKGLSKLKDTIKDIPNLFKSGATWMQRFSAATTVVGAAITAVSILVMAYRQHQQKMIDDAEKASKSALEVAQSASSESDKVLELYGSFKSAEEGTNAFKSAALSLGKALREDASDGVDELTGKLDELTKKEIEAATAAAYTAQELAGKELSLVATSNQNAIGLGRGTGNSRLDSQIQKIFGETNGTRNTAEGAAKYYESLLKIKELLESENFKNAGKDGLLDTGLYRSVTNAIDNMREAYGRYSDSIEALNMAKAREDLAEYIRTVGIDSPEAFDKYIESVENSKEYSDEYREVLLDTANNAFPQFTQAAKEAEESLGDASESVNTLEAKLKSFSESTNAADEAIGGVVEALDKFGVGSYEVYEAMLALEVAIPGSTDALYDFENGALKVDAALLGDKYSLLDLIDTQRQVTMSNAINELEKARDAALEMYASLVVAAPMLAGVFGSAAAATAGNYAKQLEQAKKDLADWDSYVDNLRSRSSYTPTTTKTGSGTSTQKTPEELALEAKESNIKLLKSQLTLLEKSDASTQERVAKLREIQNALHDEAEYMRGIHADQTEINGLSAEWWDIQKEIEELLKDTTDHLKEYEDTISALETHLELTEKQGASAEEQIETYRKIQNQLHQEAEYLRSIHASQEEIDKLSIRWWEIEEKIKGVQDDIAKTQQDLFDSLKATVDEYYDKVVSDKEKELALDEKILAVQKAQEALANAQAERKVRYYNAATGQWEWTGDVQSIKSAQASLKSAQDALNEYNTTQAQNEFKKAWEYVADQIKDGAMTFKEAYDYMYAEMKKIQDKYGVNLGLTLEDSIGGFKDINGGIGELSKEVSDSLTKSVGLMVQHLEDLELATSDLKTAWDEISEKVKSGELPLDSAFAYLKEKAQTIADKYGIDMTEALDGAIAGFDKTSGSIDELWKQVIITLMRANSVNWYSADEIGKEYLHAQNQILGKAIGATYEPGSGYWVDEKGYRIYDPKDGAPSESIPESSASGGSGSSSGGNEDAGRNSSIIDRMQENALKWWTADDETKAKLAAQNESLGKMLGATKDANGVWWDKDGYRLFDTGGILRGIGGIKATTEDEMILPPDITKQLLSPISDRFVANRLDMMRQCLGVESGKTAGAYSDYSVGTQHNGDIYNMNGYSISEKQAKSMSVYDFARLAKGLGISNQRN